VLATIAFMLAAAVGTEPASNDSIEHLKLDSAPTGIDVDHLAGRIALLGVKENVVVRAAARSALCPKTGRRFEGARLELLCNSRQMTVTLKGQTLRLRTMRRAPITTDGSRSPEVVYDPVRFGLGGPCPGDTPSSRGECALARGALVEAALALREAWSSRNEHYAHAALRLGDLAWMSGDVESAAGWYDRAGAGPFARLAGARLCELTVNCIDGAIERLHFNPWDTAGLPTDIADEILLRRVRAYAFAGRFDDSMRLLMSKTTPEHSPCTLALPLCRRLVAEALRVRANRDAPMALALALGLPQPFDGDGGLELARAVVTQTDHLGAPTYSASVLAAVSAQVPREELPSHLAATAERYIAAADTVRADIVIDFARSRGHQRTRRWQDIVRARRVLNEDGDAEGTPPAPVGHQKKESGHP